jgi:Bacteriocin-protection, YdeI or OmpD-Associated
MGMGSGRVCVGVHKATREAAGVSVGDMVSIEIERDTSPREVELPAELTDAFAADPALRSAFEAMSFTRRRERVESITGPKRGDTRARRVAHILDELSQLTA